MTAGNVLLADLEPVKGREQGGQRPVIVVSAERYDAPDMFLGVPLTTTRRALPQHIPVPANRSTGLDRACFALQGPA